MGSHEAFERPNMTTSAAPVGSAASWRDDSEQAHGPIITESSPLLGRRAPPPERCAAAQGDFLLIAAPALFWVVFSQVLLSQFICGFDSTVMASSHTVITAHFGSARAASWLSTSFLLTLTATQPFLGRMADALGRRAVFLGCLTLLAVATAACAAAGSMPALIAARALCGSAAGGVSTAGAIITADMIPIERRGLYQPYTNLVLGTGCALGSALGGMMAETLSWRWVFGIQVPVMLLCILISVCVLPGNLGLIDGAEKGIWETICDFDIAGSMLLPVTVVSLTMGLTLGGSYFPWTHPLIFTLFALSGVCLAFFVLAEHRAEKPIIPLHLVWHAPRANLLQTNMIAAMLTQSVLFNIPIYFQAVGLTNATTSGSSLMVFAAVSALVSVATGLLITWTKRLKVFLVAGAVSYMSGLVALSLLPQQLPHWLRPFILIPPAFGQGFQYTATFISVLAVSSHGERAVITSTLLLWRSLGMVLGIALSSLVIQNSLLHYLLRYVEGERKEEVIGAVRDSVAAVSQLPPPYREQVIKSYSAALGLNFACTAALACVAVLLLLPISLPRLRPAPHPTSAT